MAGATVPGPLGLGGNTPGIDPGTSARNAMPPPGSVGADAAAATAPVDPDIEALNLSPAARKAAYDLKAAQPTVKFTSGRRDKASQARAMAGNVVSNRKWIEQTYKESTLRTQCQDWVDANPGKTKAADIAAGILSVFDAASDADLGSFSKHLCGQAFDVQPVADHAEDIKKTIRGLPGLVQFLEMEGGLVRWHAEF